MKINANFTHESVSHHHDNEVHMVVSLEAPKKDWEKERAPICIVPVIDVSGSMFGNKLDYAKKSAKKLVEHLAAQDYSGLVVFDSHSKVVCPVVPMTTENKQRMEEAIASLKPGSSTNFSGGFLTALDAIKSSDLPKNINLRVIMLTDGLANVGVATTEQQLVQLITDNKDNVTVSCFGYGEGANQDILASCAKAGHANYAFIENPNDALSAFAKELGGLLSTYAKNIKLVIKASNGHVLKEVLSDVDNSGNEEEMTVRLDEILSEETRNIVIHTKLAKQTKALPDKLSPFSIEATYDIIKPDGRVAEASHCFTAQIKFVEEGEVSPPNKQLDKIVALAELIKAQAEAESLAKTGQYDAASKHMIDTSSSFKSRGLDRLALQANKLAEKMTTATLYAQSSSYLNTTRSFSRGVGISSFHSEAAKDLQELGFCASNTRQEDLMHKFSSQAETKVPADNKTK